MKTVLALSIGAYQVAAAELLLDSGSLSTLALTIGQPVYE
jgi:hypothetical protein